MSKQTSTWQIGTVLYNDDHGRGEITKIFDGDPPLFQVLYGNLQSKTSTSDIEGLRKLGWRETP